MNKNLMVSLSIQTGIKTLKNVEKLTFTQLLNLFLQYYRLEHMFDHDKSMQGIWIRWIRNMLVSWILDPEFSGKNSNHNLLKNNWAIIKNNIHSE